MKAATAERATALRAAMQRLRGGDRGALEEIYRATSAKLFGICLRILGDQGEAEDALQDVYISLWRSADRYDEDRASPISWLAIFARNRAIDRLRRRGKPSGSAPIEAASEVPDGTPDAEALLIAGEDEARIDHCMKTLEDRTQSAIRSAFFGGLTYNALAEQAEVPIGTMKSWIRRGLARLKECLERD